MYLYPEDLNQHKLSTTLTQNRKYIKIKYKDYFILKIYFNINN